MKTAKLPAVEQERIIHINATMDDIYSSVGDIYESFIDKDYKALKCEVNSLTKILKGVFDSLDETI